MSWSIDYGNLSGIIEIYYTGNVTGSDLREAVKKRISMQEETGANHVLVDASQSHDGPPIGDIFNLPDKMYPESKARRSTLIAFILPQNTKSRELARFFQTTSKNRGWTIELFEDRENAISWLADRMERN